MKPCYQKSLVFIGTKKLHRRKETGKTGVGSAGPATWLGGLNSVD